MVEEPKKISSNGIYLRPGKIIALRQKCGPDEKIIVRDNDFVIVKKASAVLKAKIRNRLRTITTINITPKKLFNSLLSRKDQ